MPTDAPKPIAMNDLGRQTKALQRELSACMSRVLASGWYILGARVRGLRSRVRGVLRRGPLHLRCQRHRRAGTGAAHAWASAPATAWRPSPTRAVTAPRPSARPAPSRSTSISTPASMNMSPGDLAARLDAGHARRDRHPPLRPHGGSAGAAGGDRARRPAAGGRLRAGARRIAGRAGRRAVGARWGASVFTPPRIWARWAMAAPSPPATRRWRAGHGRCASTAGAAAINAPNMAATAAWTKCRRPSCASNCRTSTGGMRAAAKSRAPIRRHWPAPAHRVECPREFGDESRGAPLRGPLAAREWVRDALGRAGIATDIHYPVPDHLQDGGARHRAGSVHLPETERAAREILTLPCYSELETEEDRHVTRSAAGAAGRRRLPDDANSTGTRPRSWRAPRSARARAYGPTPTCCRAR